MFQDEARFGRISDVRRCWAPKPLRPLCQAMLTHEYTYAYAAVDVNTGVLDSLVLPHVNTDCMQVFLDEVAQRHCHEHILLVLDGAGWHRSNTLVVPPNMHLLPLPPYAPELNPVEHLWDELRAHQGEALNGVHQQNLRPDYPRLRGNRQNAQPDRLCHSTFYG